MPDGDITKTPKTFRETISQVINGNGFIGTMLVVISLTVLGLYIALMYGIVEIAQLPPIASIAIGFSTQAIVAFVVYLIVAYRRRFPKMIGGPIDNAVKLVTGRGESYYDYDRSHPYYTTGSSENHKSIISDNYLPS